MKKHHSRFIVGLAMTVVPLGSGCGKKDVPPAPAPATSPADPSAGDANPRRDPEPAPDAEKPSTVAAPELPGPFATAGLYAVPKTAPFVVVASVKKLLESFGYEGLMAKYGPLMESVTGPLMELTGKDFTKLATWAEVGVDLDASMGVFMPELKSPAIATFVTLSDAAKFAGFINEVGTKAGQKITSEKVGDATLYTMGERDREAFVIKGNMLYSANLPRGNGAAALVKELAARTAADSITSLPELKTTLDGLATDELGVFVQLKSIIDETLIAQMERRAKEASSQFDAQLAAAKAADDKAEIARLEGVSADEKAYQERVAKRRAAELELTKEVTAGLSTLAMGVDVSDFAAETSVRLPLVPGSLLTGLFKNATDVQPILKALGTAPLMVASGQVDPEKMLAFFEKMAAADGEDLSEVRAGLKSELGVDLDKDIVGALTGEVGFGLTGDLSAMLANGDPMKELGGALVLGIKSDASIIAAISKVAAMEGISEIMKWDAATKTLTVSPPESKPIHVTFVGNHMIASTDLETANRLAGGESFVGSIGNAKLKALLERKDLAALFSMRQMFFAGYFLLMRGGYDMYTPPVPENASAELKAKYAELAKLDAELPPLRAKREEERMRPVLEAFEKLGTYTQTLTMDAQGASATMGIYTNAKVPEVVMSLIDMGLNMSKLQDEPSEADKHLRELEDQRWKLESEINNATRPSAKEEMAPEPE